MSDLAAGMVEAALRTAVHESLALYMYDNAKFLCERLYYDSRTEETVHLLATCYFQAGETYRAYCVLKNTTSAANRLANDYEPWVDNNHSWCRYLLSLCCYHLGKLQEAEFAMTGNSFSRLTQNCTGHHETLAQIACRCSAFHLFGMYESLHCAGGKEQANPNDVPNGSAGLYLLGLICMCAVPISHVFLSDDNFTSLPESCMASRPNPGPTCTILT